MNIKKLIKAGLIAAFLIILCAMLLVPIVGSDMDIALSKLHLPPLSVGAMVYFFSVSISLGLILMWLYVALLPRFKRRVKTAVIASLVVWFLAYFLANVSMVAYGFMPIKLTIIGTLWGLIELLVASLIASLFYSE